MTGITSKYKVKKFPKIMAIGVDKKTKFYEGETKYKPIMDFCNIYQETFFVVGSDSTPNDAPKKPWMTEKFPEITIESGNEICFKVDGTICVFLINKEKPNEQLENIFMEVQNWLSPKINRGAKYKFGWLNSSKQIKFVEAMKLEKEAGPLLVLINHGSRKRYHIHDGELKEDALHTVFEKLASGEIRFTPFPGNKIPDLDE